MDAKTAAREFGELFPRVYHRFYRRVAASEHRHSAESLALLEHLARSGPLTVTEAARHFERSQSAMSEIVARLEQRGLLERVADERDRRRTLVWLGAEGLEAVERARQVLSPALLEQALRQLTPAERATLVGAMDRLLRTEPERRDAPGDDEHPSTGDTQR